MLYMAGRLGSETYQPGQFTEDGLPLTGRMIVGACAVSAVSGIAAAEHESGPLVFAGMWILVALVALALWAVKRRKRNRQLD